MSRFKISPWLSSSGGPLVVMGEGLAENTALVMPGSAEVIFSFEENFFYGQFVRPMAAPR